LIAIPPLLIVAREIPSRQLIEGGFATGGGGGGGGVGVVGVLHAAPINSTTTMGSSPTRVAQYFNLAIYTKQRFYRTSGRCSV
jgi:hypothetical protein